MEIYEEAMDFTKEYKDVIKTKKKDIILFKYQQDKVFENLRKIDNLKVLLNNLK